MHQGERKLAVLGTVLLVISSSLILYGSTQPPNIAIQFYTPPSEKVNLFWFIGVFIALFDLACWVILFFRHFRKWFVPSNTLIQTG